MNRRFAQTTFQIEATQDGSLTLRLADNGESMHHSGGAAAETHYIYSQVISKALHLIPNSQITVVGLGMGYIEMSWAILVNNFSKNTDDDLTTQLISYEKNTDLKVEFEKWVFGNSDLSEIYENAFLSLGGQLTELDQVKKILSVNLSKNSIRGELTKSEIFIKKSQVICYDAFSSKTDSELWSEDFLNYFLKNCCDEDCVFTTYACTGTLKKCLSDSGFNVIKRPGFQGKRDSTLALKGKFSSFETLFRTF